MSTLILVYPFSGGGTSGCSTENMTNPEQEKKTIYNKIDNSNIICLSTQGSAHNGQNGLGQQPSLHNFSDLYIYIVNLLQ